MKTFELFKGRWHYWTVYYPGSLIRLSSKRGEKILKIGNFHWVNFLFTFLLLWWQSSCKHISNNDDTQTRKTQRKIYRTDVALKSNQSTARPNIWVGAMSHDTLISRKVSTRWGLFLEVSFDTMTLLGDHNHYWITKSLCDSAKHWCQICKSACNNFTRVHKNVCFAKAL